MRLLLAPDKFKETFTAAQVCALLSRGIREVQPGWSLDCQPLADGGEGTMDILMEALGGARVPLRTRGPMGAPVDTAWGLTQDGTAVLESAVFLGLHLVPPSDRDPMKASSYGLGEAIAAALEAGAVRFLIGLGGVATVDGGMGMARALGFRFADASGRPLQGRGADLIAVASLDSSMAHPALREARFTALCDVSHPLTGPGGAARTFGPQKGATPAQVAEMETGLIRLAGVVAPPCGRAPEALCALPLGGAAGGLGAAMACLLNASLDRGAIFLMRLLLSPARIGSADIIVTGEGSLDEQTTGGKVVAAVLAEAASAGRSVIVVAGRWDGTLPAPRPQVVEVLGPGPGSPPLGAPDLIELGRRIGRQAGRLANRDAR